MSKNFEHMRLPRRERPDAIEPFRGTTTFAVQKAAPRSTSNRQSPSEWFHAIDVLRKYWRWSAAFAFLVTACVTVLVFLTKPVYEPVARIEVGPPGSEQFSLLGSESHSDAGEYAETQAKTLQSDQLAIAVIRKLNLQQNPIFIKDLPKANDVIEASSQAPAIDSADGELTPAETHVLRKMRKDLHVQRDTASWLINVSYESTDPRLAATITNAITEEFLDAHYRARHDAIIRSTAWLSQQLDDIRVRMDESNHALTAYQRESGITPMGAESSFDQEMAELYRQVAAAQGERMQLEALMTSVNSKPADLPQSNTDPVVQELSKKLATTRADLTQARVIYGPSHPKVKEFEAQIGELQAELRAQQSYLFHNLQTSYAAAHSREQLLDSALNGTKRKITQMAEYQTLKKQADANAELYNTLYTKVKEAGIAAESKSNDIRWVDRARTPDQPVRPRKVLQISLGLLAGMVGGVLLAFVRGSLDTRVHTLEDMRASTGLGRISVVPLMDGATGGKAERMRRLTGGSLGSLPASRLPLIHDPRSVTAEALRGLFTSVQLSQPAGPPHVLLVASPLPSEGKTTIAVSLAISLSRLGSTCILDTDVRKSDVAKTFVLPDDRGLADVLKGSCRLEEALQVVPAVPNLSLLASGRMEAEPGEMLTTEAMRELIRQLRARFEFVVIDSPPVLPFAEGRAISSLVDGVIFVTRSGVTTNEAIQRSFELLENVQSAPVLEVVLNGVSESSSDYRYQYGQYS
jgi:capsular exopolysaccharide synthesis family protein